MLLHRDSHVEVKPLLFRDHMEAAIFLISKGFTVYKRTISFSRRIQSEHRVLYAIDWLESKHGYTYAGPIYENNQQNRNVGFKSKFH